MTEEARPGLLSVLLPKEPEVVAFLFLREQKLLNFLASGLLLLGLFTVFLLQLVLLDLFLDEYQESLGVYLTLRELLEVVREPWLLEVDD